MKIVVCFSKKVSISDILKAKKQGMDIAEIRVDLLDVKDPAELIRQINLFKSIPVLLTIRSRVEGGAWKASEEARLDLFEVLMPYVDYVDIELSSDKILKSVVSFAKKNRKKIIISFHDFKHMPTEAAMKQIKSLAKKAGADIVKIAAKANSHEDFKSMGLFTLNNKQNDLVAIAMGSHGSASRILFPLLGSQMTYTFMGKPTAPGQMSLATISQYIKKAKLR